MPADRTAGMDNPHYSYSSLPSRPQLRWPDDLPVAFAVVVLVEHVERQPPPEAVGVNLPGGFIGSSFPAPNLSFTSQREYGHRAGIFRVLDALTEAGVPATIAMDAMAAERYPIVVDACIASGGEILAHGIAASQVISSAMTEADERAYIAESRQRLERATDASVTGWMSPEQSESERTPKLLDELGFGHVCDWPNDDQPYRMATPQGLISVPTSYMLDDGFAVWGRREPPDSYTTLVERSFETLATEGRGSGRTMVLVVRPWLSGQPFRIAALENALAAVTSSGAAWATTVGGIASAYRDVAGGVE